MDTLELIRTEIELTNKAVPITELMARKIARFETDADFLALAHDVEKNLEANFFGTYLVVPVSGKPEHIQVLIWTYRNAGWNVTYQRKNEKEEFLMFADPASQTVQQTYLA